MNGATATNVDLCGIPLAHPIVNASGTFDAIAARRAFGDSVLERFPFSAYVSKTITPAPRVGNPPPRLWEEPAAMVNSIGLPNKGLEGFLATDLPQLAELPGSPDRLGDGDERRGVRPAGRGRRRARGGGRDSSSTSPARTSIPD